MAPIYQIKITEPCHEDWNKMSPAERGRFCGACQKQVVDFSTMTDAEVVRHLQQATASICARAGNDQLNRVFRPIPSRQSVASKYWFAFLAGMSLFFGRAEAQAKKPKQPKHHPLVRPDERRRFPGLVTMGAIATIRSVGQSWTLTGTVVDEDNQPIPFASVLLGSQGQGNAADSTGRFIIEMDSRPDSLKVSVSCAGYEQRDLVVYPEENGIVDMGEILLKQKLLKEVVVMGISPENCRKTVGLTAVVTSGATLVSYRTTIFQRVKTTVKEWVTGSEVKVLPNPISRSTRFNVQLAPKTMGEYTVQLTDMNGRIVGGRKLTIHSPVQIESFDGQIFSSAGVYVVSLISHETGKVVSNRLMVL